MVRLALFGRSVGCSVSVGLMSISVQYRRQHMGKSRIDISCHIYVPVSVTERK